MKDKIDELMNSLTKEEIIIMFKELMNDYEGMEELILFRYVSLDESEEIKKNKKYLSNIIKRYGNGRRFVSLRECCKFSGEVFEVLYTAKKKYLDTKKPLVAIETAINILKNMLSAIQYMDDSNGDIGDIINESISLVREICIDSNEFTKKEKTKIFNILLKQGDNPIYDGFEDYMIPIINECICFCDDEKLRTKFQNKLDDLFDSCLDDWSGEYKKESILGLKLQLIGIYGTDTEEREFIEKNIKHSGFRELLINILLENNEYERVLELANEGEIRDKKFPGLVRKWKGYRYIACKNLNRIDEKKELAKELFFNGDMDFYYELKDMYKDEWSSYYLELKKEFKCRKLDRLNIYPEMLIEENDLEELLQFVREDVRRIEIYDELLLKDYREHVNIIYKFLIEGTADMASNRGAYRKVCRIIKRYKILFGDIEAYKIIKSLQQKYIKRPAFIDELGKC